MPVRPTVVLALLAACLAVGAPPTFAAAGRWRPPLPSATVVAPFAFTPAAPYERGARRGLDLRGVPGAPVVAPCAGVVAYAGPLPGARWRAGVTVRCGGLMATVLGLRAPAVRRGAHVLAGERLGVLDGAGRLRLGARRAGRRDGYLDPAALLAAPPGFAAPPARGPRPVARRPAPARRPPAPPRAPASPHRSGLPVWGGLALLAVGVCGGALVGRRPRRRARAEAVPAQR